MLMIPRPRPWITAFLASVLSIINPQLISGQQDALARDVVGAAQTMAQHLSGMTVAVFDFPDLEGRVSNLSRLISEEFTTGLVQYLAPNGTVVERHQVIQVIAELELQETDLTAADMSRAGRQLGADAIIVGTTAIVGQQIVVNIRAVDVERGRVLAAARASARGTRELLSMATEGHDGPSLSPRPSSNSTAPPAAPASSSSPTVTSPRADRFVQRAGAVALRLERCFQTGRGVRCDFTAIASRDTRFSIVWMGFLDNGPTVSRNRLVDSQGNEHRATELGIGGQLRDFGDPSSELIASVPVRASVQFTGVQETEALPLLEIQVWTDEQFYALRYRDVRLNP